MIEAARERLARHPHVRAQVADVHELPFPAASFDAVLLFHTLTYAERPTRALAECARVLRPDGRLVLLCLNKHQQLEVTARYGERHPGFSPGAVRGLLSRAGSDGRFIRGRVPGGEETPSAGRRSRSPTRRRRDRPTVPSVEEAARAPHRHHRRRDGHDHPHLRDDGSRHPRRRASRTRRRIC